MAHLTESQRKKRNKFVALLIGIAVLAIAIIYVAYTGVMSKSAYLEDDELAVVLSEVFDERVRAVSEEDLSTVKYLEVYGNDYSGYGTGVIALGFDDFLTAYNELVAQSEADEAETAEDAEDAEETEVTEETDAAEETETTDDTAAEEVTETTEDTAAEEVTETTEDTATEEVTETTDDTAAEEVTETTEDTAAEEVVTDPAQFIKSAYIDFDEEATFNDIKYFTGAEIISVTGVQITDPEAFKSLTSLKEGTFLYCGITDVSGFASLDLTKIEKINLTGNNITDWTALEPIADKVIVNENYSYQFTEDGSLIPVYLGEVTLADQMAAEAEAEAEESEENGEATDTTESTEADVVETEDTTENAEADVAETENEAVNTEVEVTETEDEAVNAEENAVVEDNTTENDVTAE